MSTTNPGARINRACMVLIIAPIITMPSAATAPNVSILKNSGGAIVSIPCNAAKSANTASIGMRCAPPGSSPPCTHRRPQRWHPPRTGLQFSPWQCQCLVNHRTVGAAKPPASATKESPGYISLSSLWRLDDSDGDPTGSEKNRDKLQRSKADFQSPTRRAITELKMALCSIASRAMALLALNKTSG